MVIQCEHCMVTLPSEEAMETHNKGKRHQRLVSIHEEKTKLAGVTVFTRGFKDDITQEQLEEYFSKFGKVEKIYLEMKRSPFALVQFVEESSVEAALAQTEHELNGEKISVLPRKVKKAPMRVQNIHKLRNKKLAEINAEEATNKRDIEIYEEITKKLEGLKSVEEQMRVVADSLRMTEEEIVQKKELSDNLLDAMVKFFPGCTLHQFGSSVNGFGVQGCDSDVYLDFHEEEEHVAMETGENEEKIKLPYYRDIRSLTKSEGPLTSADLKEMTPYDKVKLVSRIIVEHVPGCNNILAIPSARCPLIRFLHKPSGIRCDLSINNKLALRNTRLLQLCSRIDDRVGLLVFTIRYWAKVKEIAGYSGPRLTNYGLTFLVIQYLQNLPNPVLPTITKLSDLAGKEKVIIDGWDCSYLDEAAAFGPSTNTDSVECLLKGFFEYYARLDFSTVVIQTRNGQLLPIKKMVEQIHSLGEAKDFKIGPMSIQDPFVLDHNIGGNVTEKIKQKISEEFQIAAKKCEKWSMNTEKEHEFGVLGLLSKDIPPELVEDLLKLREMDENMDIGHSLTIVLKVAQLPLEAFKDTRTPDFRLNWCFRVCLFIQRVFETILMFETEILAQTITGEIPKELVEPTEDVLEMDMKSELTSPSPRKRRSPRGESTGNQKKSREEPIVKPVKSSEEVVMSKVQTLPPGCGRSPSLHMELLCSACCPIWNGRKPLRREVQVDGEELEGLELEREISEYIIETIGYSPKYILQFQCDFDTIVETSKTAVRMKFLPINSSKEFVSFFSFFRTFTRKLVDKSLYEVW